MCHTCRFLHGSPEALEIVRRFGREVEERIMDRYLLAMTAQAVSTAL
jgi:hypothetical protein